MFLQLWPLCYQYMFDSYVTCLTVSFDTICVLSFTLIFCAFMVSNSNYFGTSKSILSQSRCSLEPKDFLRGLYPVICPLRSSKYPSDPPAPLRFAILAFLLIMFIPGTMFVYFPILFSTGFSEINPGHNKTA